MTTTHFHEGYRAGEFLMGTEVDPNYSRDVGIIASGQNLGVGTVLGKVVTAGTGTATAGTNTGNGAMGAITVGAGAVAGTYTLKIIKAVSNAGDFELIDPYGDVVGIGAVAAAFSGGGLSFTLADGSSDFVVGDTFKIVVTAITEKWYALAPTATDGSQRAAGILYADTDATSADTNATIVTRYEVVNYNLLVWPNGITAAQKATAVRQLDALGIIVRNYP